MWSVIANEPQLCMKTAIFSMSANRLHKVKSFNLGSSSPVAQMPPKGYFVTRVQRRTKNPFFIRGDPYYPLRRHVADPTFLQQTESPQLSQYLPCAIWCGFWATVAQKPFSLCVSIGFLYFQDPGIAKELFISDLSANRATFHASRHNSSVDHVSTPLVS